MQVTAGQAGAEPAQKERGDGGYGMREEAWKRKKRSEGRRGLAFFSVLGEKNLAEIFRTRRSSYGSCR